MYELMEFFGVSNAHDLQVGFHINDCSTSSEDSDSSSSSLRNSFDEGEENSHLESTTSFKKVEVSILNLAFDSKQILSNMKCFLDPLNLIVFIIHH